jgi:hypothetical protein
MKTLQQLTAVAKRNVLVNSVPDALLSADTPIDAIPPLFKHYVREVEIETHSLCNRTCIFCPNAFIDRLSDNFLMTDTAFDKIIGGLASIDYSAKLLWARYSEPLAHPSIVTRIAAARRALPRARLEVISNGDYLTVDLLRQLETAGVDVIGVDLYDNPEEPRTRDGNEAMLAKFEKRTGLTRGDGSFDTHFLMKGTSITLYCGLPNFAHEYLAEKAMAPGETSHRERMLGLSTRGGLIDVPRLRTYRRSSACLHTLVRPTIDYNGRGVFCCHVRSDAKAHASVTVGDLNQPGYTLFHMYRDLGPVRRDLLSYGPKAGVCGGCNSSEESELVGRRPWLSTALSPIRPLIYRALDNARR